MAYEKKTVQEYITETEDETVEGFNNNQETRIKAGFDKHMAESTTQIITSTRDLSLTGDQIINTSINKQIKGVICFAAAENSLKASWGFADENLDQLSVNSYSNGNFTGSAFLIQISELMGTNRKRGVLKNLGVGNFTIEWTNVGTGATGELVMRFLVFYHGGD